jgi:ABC-type nickel/cobalt efflux system permease component RcnA
MSMNIFLIFLAAICFWIQIWATLLVLRDSYAEPSQRAMQLALVWLLPGLGAVVVFAVHRPEEKHSKQYRAERDAPDEFATFGQRARRSPDSTDDE